MTTVVDSLVQRPGSWMVIYYHVAVELWVIWRSSDQGPTPLIKYIAKADRRRLEHTECNFEGPKGLTNHWYSVNL